MTPRFFTLPMVTLIGANGADKTTLPNTMTGIVPSTGSRTIHRRDVTSLTVEQGVAVGTCLVPAKQDLSAA